MIKIIKPGTIKKCTCGECGCLFSYEDEDVFVDGAYSMDQLRPRDKYIKCPQCKEKIGLEVTR